MVKRKHFKIRTATSKKEYFLFAPSNDEKNIFRKTYIDKYPLQQNEPGCSLRMFYEHKFSDNTVYKHKS